MLPSSVSSLILPSRRDGGPGAPLGFSGTEEGSTGLQGQQPQFPHVNQNTQFLMNLKGFEALRLG